MPEVVAIDIAMSEPEAGVVGVVRFFPRDPFDKGKLPCEMCSGCAHEWIEAGDPGVGPVLGKELSVDEDTEVEALLLDRDGCGDGCCGEQGKCESKS